jgi:hypothetical protein
VFVVMSDDIIIIMCALPYDLLAMLFPNDCLLVSLVDVDLNEEYIVRNS